MRVFVGPKDEIYESDDTLLFAAHNNFLLAMHMWVQTRKGAPAPAQSHTNIANRESFFSSVLACFETVLT